MDREREWIQPEMYTLLFKIRLYSAMMIHFWLARWLFASHLTFNYIVIHSTSLNLKKSSGNWAEAKWREKKSFKFEFAHSAKQLGVYTSISLCVLTHSLTLGIRIESAKKIVTYINWIDFFLLFISSSFSSMLFTVTFIVRILFKFSSNNDDDDDSSSYFKLSYEKRHFLINFVLDLFGSLRFGKYFLELLESCYGWIFL